MPRAPELPRPPAVLLVGHGSRLPSVETDLARLASTVAKLTRLPSVEPCLLRDLDSALERCAVRGATDVLVQPFFLGMVGELASRLRRRVFEWQARSPERRGWVGEALGEHPRVTGAIRDSALRALAGRSGTVVLVGHGSPEAGWSTALQAQANRLRSLALFEDVVPAFLGHEEPRLFDLLGELCGEVAIVPFFLSRGMHTSVELPAVLKDALPPTKRVRIAPFWADDPRVALAVADRVGGPASELELGIPTDRLGRASSALRGAGSLAPRCHGSTVSSAALPEDC